MTPSPYDVLGVAVNASIKEIKAAYRSLSQMWHPDKPTGDTEKFKMINKAYEILSDATRRAKYDNTGSTGKADLRTGAINVIMKIFMSLMSSVDTRTCDFLRSIEMSLVNTIEDKQKNIREDNKKIDQCENVKKNFIKKSEGNNIFVSCMEQQISSCNLSIEGNETEIEILKRAQELLEDYDYSMDVGLFLSGFSGSVTTGFYTGCGP